MMKNKNIVFIAKSLDGYIADKKGGLDWLNIVPNPNQLDMGFTSFMERVDALLMGRNTFETVCSFGIPWPYTKPVFVLSNTLKEIPEDLKDKVELLSGSLSEILEMVNGKRYNNLYIDGGRLIQSFLREDRIDELIITTIPVLLGGGVPLFGELPSMMEFEHLKSEVFLGEIVQDSYKRKR